MKLLCLKVCYRINIRKSMLCLRTVRLALQLWLRQLCESTILIAKSEFMNEGRNHLFPYMVRRNSNYQQENDSSTLSYFTSKLRYILLQQRKIPRAYIPRGFNMMAMVKVQHNIVKGTQLMLCYALRYTVHSVYHILVKYTTITAKYRLQMITYACPATTCQTVFLVNNLLDELNN